MHSLRFLFASLALLVPLLAAAADLPAVYHQDARGTLKLEFEPRWQAPADLSGEALARSFLSARAADFGLAADLSDLAPARIQESLLGTHYRFVQKLHGIELAGGEIIVSIARTDGRVYRVYSNYYPLDPVPAMPPVLLGEEAAFDIAWQHLRAHGELLSSPAAKLSWIARDGGARLVYALRLELSAPYGAWEISVDAASGEVLGVQDGRIYRVPDELTTLSPAERIAEWQGPVSDRRAAFARAQAALAAEVPAGGGRAMGTGVVFDPDPRATLLNDNLQDGSPAGSFAAAYFTRDLLDITFSTGLYRVTGPWINIINWDPPNTAPSTTTDGHWTATRGNNAFNDAMTYFQIDQNERYMQSLGFTGPTGIQEGPIGVDTDGVNGADNSYYYSGTNRIAYGHGCVDDSEDVDVMLHEYGHAIEYDINSNWGGGDTGAIGEGFGDYWAGSYSYDTPNGHAYHPEWVFSWDGHGTGNQCWPGRLLNKLNLIYNHNIYYGAHQNIPGGSSDELWSTPLFQSLIALEALGQSRESVDQIILEAHFGIGAGPKMRDMAYAIIDAAHELQPAGPHALIFTQKFAHHGIVDDLTAAPGQAAPAGAVLAQNHPNPFNPRTEIRFDLPAGGAQVELAVFDITGRLVNTLLDGVQAAGEHRITWNGDDAAGRPVSAGVYFYRLETGGSTLTRKMVLLK